MSRRFVTLTIKGGVPEPLKPHLGKQTFVCWVNEDDRDYWIKFLGTDWPFKGLPVTIFVEALEPTPWFKVSSKGRPGTSKSHKYALKLDPGDPDPPPDGPDVIVDS